MFHEFLCKSKLPRYARLVVIPLGKTSPGWSPGQAVYLVSCECALASRFSLRSRVAAQIGCLLTQGKKALTRRTRTSSLWDNQTLLLAKH